MKVKHIVENLRDWDGDTNVVGFIYNRFDAEETINQMNDGIFDEDDMTKHLTDSEWESVVLKMHGDEGVWQYINEAFDYYINRVIELRGKGNHDNSKRIDQSVNL